MKHYSFMRNMAAVALAGAMLFSIVPAAQATPTKKQQAEALKQEIDSLDDSLEIAVEDYNEANNNYQTIVSKCEKTEKKIKQTNEKLVDVKGKLSTRATAQYRQGQLSFLDVLLGAESFEDFASVWGTLNQLNDADTELVVEMKELKAEQEELKAELTSQRKDAKEQLNIANNKKNDIETKKANREAKLNSVNAEIRAEAEALRRQEEARAAARARSVSSSGGGGGSAFSNSYPSPSYPANGSVVDIAKSRLGCPYVWAASGPNTFDCSGLTMWAYGKVGVSLPHSSRAQINCGARVSRSDLQPGDLVFFGSPIHHVGMYVGGGMMIHAPHTGDVVKISPLHSNYVGACRPR